MFYRQLFLPPTLLFLVLLLCCILHLDLLIEDRGLKFKFHYLPSLNYETDFSICQGYTEGDITEYQFRKSHHINNDKIA